MVKRTTVSEIEAAMDEVNPVHYAIHLEPDLTTFTFSGRVEISLEATRATKEITLNAKELSFRSCKLIRGRQTTECPFSVDARKELVAISLPEDMSGAITLEITFTGEINDRMVGFYRSSYSAGGETRYCAVTQFQESDARRAFPCLDHPSKKASFDIGLVIAERLVAISNTPIAEETPLPEGRKMVRFRRTPKMSTYLLFFGVGEFEFIEDPGKTILRAATMPGMRRHAHFGLEFGRKALVFCEEYYGVRYPLPKLDLVAVPDFASGAMENWGAITFRENLLLHHPDITSKAGEQRICEVIAHEIVHQWFGDLVTPSDWIYLWLNESFATYFGYGIVAHCYPHWDIWGQFLHGQTNAALNRDALHETFPIELPGAEHAVINASTAPIIYNKGASILRHLVGYIGENNFKKGLRHYLREYEYSSAASRNMWEAFEQTSEKPVVSMMKSWVEQDGFPLLEVTRRDGKLHISQRRFTYLANTFDQQWFVPITIRVFHRGERSSTITFLLDTKAAVIDIGEDVIAYKVNFRQAGFYRVKYLDAGNLAELGTLVRTKSLPPEDRWGLQDDLYALARCGDASLAEYLDFLSNYKAEDTFLPLISIAGNLYHAYLVLDGARRAGIASFGRSFLENVLSRIGYEPQQDEAYPSSILRDAIMPQAAVYGSEVVLKFAMGAFSRLTTGGSIHPDIAKSVLHIGALNGGKEMFEWLKHRLMSSASEHERMNILAALGGFRDRTILETVQDYILMEVPSRNKFIPISSMAANPHAIPSLWDWFVSHLDRIEQFHPAHFDRVIEAIVPIAGIEREEQVHAFFEQYMREKDKAGDVIRMSLEKLRINANMRRSGNSITALPPLD
jgi:tricorn protease interacting factor F2/3